MFVQFSVGNYRSFQERNTLSLLAANLKAQDKRVDAVNTFEQADLCLLKTAAIYGANASGKSNLIKAVRFMRQFILDSARAGQATDTIPVEPFALDLSSEDKPTSFELIFILDDIQHRYGFEATKTAIFSEWLYRKNSTRETTLFERDGAEIKVGTTFKEGRGLEARTRPNALFLSVVAQFNGVTSSAILSWLTRLDVHIGMNTYADRSATAQSMARGERGDQIREFMRLLDLGMESLVPVTTNAPLMIDIFDETEQSYTLAIEELSESIREAHDPQIQTIHRVYDEQGKSIGLRTLNLDHHESDGTQKLFSLAGPFMDALETGRVMVIDELDVRLHPLIIGALIELFQNEQTNPHNAQLIFTTHDTNLLNNKRFRRDQIWFIEKDRYGRSHLYSLAEYHVRNDATYETDYIKGRYGAVPFIGDISTVVEAHDA